MTDSLLNNPMLIGPLALAMGAGGSAAYHGISEELVSCQPLIEHALNHQRKDMQIEQITIRVHALDDK